MSALTKEWRLKTGENSIKYTVVVPNFMEKIKTFKVSEIIWSKDFKVGRSVFCLDIEPSGTELNSRYVAVYLHNKSGWEVIVNAEFKVNNFKKELKKNRKFGVGDDWGFAEMIPHNRCSNRDLLSDGSLHLEVFIELVNEEVLSYQSVDDEASLVNRFQSIESKFSTMEERMAALEAGSRTRNDKLAERLEVMDRKISSLSPGGASSIRDLECPVWSVSRL